MLELNPNREYYIDKKGQVRKKKKAGLLCLYNEMSSFAKGYCTLKQCYLTQDNISEKKCVMKGLAGYGCRHLIFLEGDECRHGIKKAKMRRWKKYEYNSIYNMHNSNSGNRLHSRYSK